MPQQDDEQASLLAENPYFHRGPIKDRRFFYGRAAEMHQAFQVLRHGQSVSIVGPRRIGKTSLLFHLCDPEIHQTQDLGDEYRFVYIDGQWTGDLDKSRFYQLIWYETRKAFTEGGKAADLPESVANFRELQTALTKVQKKGIKPILLLDEFEVMAFNPNLDQDFFSDLRSLTSLITYVTVSARSLYDLTYADGAALSSPFFNIFREIPLGFFRSDEARGAVLGPARTVGLDNLFTDQDLRFLFEELAGYHPFYLQIACYYLFERKLERGELAEADRHAVRQQYAEDVERHFQYAWDHLEPEERALAQLVREGKTNRLGDEMKRRLERQCILSDDSLFSLVFAEFVGQQLMDGRRQERSLEKLAAPLKRVRANWRRWAVWVTALAVTFAAAVSLALYWFFFLSPAHFGPKSLQQQDIRLTVLVSYPAHLALGDEGSIEITLSNEGAEKLIDVKAFFIYSGQLPMRMVSESGNVARFESLDPGEKKSVTVKIALTDRGSGAVGFDLKIAATTAKSQQELSVILEEVGSIAPANFPPFARSLLGGLWTHIVMIVVGIITAILTMPFKK